MKCFLISEFLCDLVVTILTKGIGLNPNDLKFDSTNESVLFAFSNEIFKYFVLFSVSLTIVYFLIEMNRKIALEGHDLNLKSFFTPFLKLLIAVFVLSQGAKIVSLLIELSNLVITEISNINLDGITLTDGDAGISEELLENLKTEINRCFGCFGLITSLLLALPCIACWLISIALGLVWKFKAITYKIEFFYRIAITPIALSDIYSGQNATAIKWLKGILAFGLYGASMIFIVRITALLNLNTIADFVAKLQANNALGIFEVINLIVGCLVIPFAGLGCMSALHSASKEVFSS